MAPLGTTRAGAFARAVGPACLGWLVVGLAVLGSGCCPLLGGRRDSPLAVLKGADGRLAEVVFSKQMSFAGARLYDYMDGAAEAYYAKGFRELGIADAKWRSTEAAIELYRVDGPANAKALFEEFNVGKGKELPAGLGSAAWDARELEGIFYRGRYFCRVIIVGNDNEARQFRDALSAAIDQSIPD